jgi:hypothetical protein
LLSAAQGDMTQGCFYFERFNLSKASVIIDSETPMTRSYDLERDGIILPYLVLINSSRKSDFGCGISIEDFKENGRFLLVFHLNSGLQDRSFALGRTGNFKINLEFKEALQKPVQVVVWSAFDSQALIDKFNSVTEATIV